MCLNPRQIVNPSKYISLKYRDPYLLNVPCGKCAECQREMSNQWFFRAWQECIDIKEAKGFVYFDSLTYRDSSLPTMKDLVNILPEFPCFNSMHIRKFVDNLSKKVKRNFGVKFRYFISSEYGTDDRFTHRPHYHVLFFVKNHDSNLSPLKFSALVADLWKHGRTDGIPYKTAAYVLQHNVIESSDVSGVYLRACRYVTKYVQKSSVFDKEIEKRLSAAWFVLVDKFGEDWSNSVHAQRTMSKIKRNVRQFHRQSQGFGASFLSECDIDQLFRDGCLFMPSPKGLKIPVSIPMYYKRKLFYDMVIIDGAKTWVLNELGMQYKQARKENLISMLADTFYDASLNYGLGYDMVICRELADYVYNTQGRIKADVPSGNLLERLPSVSLFNYVTLTDKERLSHRGIIDHFIGNPAQGYSVDSLPPSYRIGNFIKKYVFYDVGNEEKLSKIYYHLSCINEQKQEAFDLVQRLEQFYKGVRENML